MIMDSGGATAQAMARESDVLSGLLAKWVEMPRLPGRVFCDRLQKPLREAGRDAFVEQTCQPFAAQRMVRPTATWPLVLAADDRISRK
ncbi:MAG: hypothetical protein ACREC9_10220 [Methylocella sp.]